MILFKFKKHKKFNEVEIENVKLDIPYSKYGNAKVIIIHDIDNLGQESNLNEMIKLEKENNVKSIMMLLPNTLSYADKFDLEVGVHETFPFNFKNHLANFHKNGLNPKTFSQHVAIKATNFYPLTLNSLPESIKYSFIDPVSYGKERSRVLFYKPKKYKHITLISVVYEVSKNEIDKILEKANEEEGDRKSTRLNSSHTDISRMPSSA